MTASAADETRRSSIEASYDSKPDGYFSDARDDIVALLETHAESSILELGCGDGATARAAIAAGKAGRYVGLELNQAAAATAARTLTEVVVGNVEALELDHFKDQFDALIISEVLEHLTDPWTNLQRLTSCLKPGGVIFASSPNVAHWGLIKELIFGRFRYEEKGVMDRTHLRWFTPETYGAMFEGAGIDIEQVRPVRPFSWKARLINGLTGNRFRHLFMAQVMVVGRRR